jgi:hypothetical protein
MAPGYFGLPIGTAEPCHQLYRYADLSVASAWPLVELPTVEPHKADNPNITFGPRVTPAREPANSEWLHHWPDESGAMSLAQYDGGSDFLLRFPGLADFVISEDGRAIGVWPAPETSTETLRHLVLDQVLPRVLAQQGRLVLHAGAVRVGQKAIAFIGDTGRGKSTLTASFQAAGSPLLSDDGLVLTQENGAALAQPTYSSLRLWPEAIAGLFARAPDLAPMAHYSRKQRVILTDVADHAPMPLAAVYVLFPEAQEDSASILLTRMSPSEACMAIISNSFQLDVTDRRRAMGLLTVASGIAQELPVFSLAFPRRFACLPDVRKVVLRQHCQKATSDS